MTAAPAPPPARAPEQLFLLGHPVAHSLSPAIQNAALRAAGISAHYETRDVSPDALMHTLAELRAAGAGGNVTVPHKTRVFDACDVVSDLAARVGAVNTFWVDADGRLVGDNTDVGGFSAAARVVLQRPPEEITVGVYGAGGAAAAVLAAVESWPGCVAQVYNRTPERARALCARFGTVAHAVDDIGAVAGTDLVVNATSIGLRTNDVPVDPALIPSSAVVLDLVYRPGATPFVRTLRAHGIRADDGITMLVEQAALAFTRWFGREPDRSVMWSALPS